MGISLSFLILLSIFSSSLSRLSPSPSSTSHAQRVAANISSTATNTITDIRRTISHFHWFEPNLHGPSPSLAFDYCLNVLDLTIHELNWTLESTTKLQQQPYYDHAHQNTMSNHVADIVAWLSGAFGNEGCCTDSLKRHNSSFHSLFRHSYGNARASILRMLGMARGLLDVVNSHHNLDGDGPYMDGPDLPKWVERRLLDSPLEDLTVNVTVSLDGSGDFTTLTDAIAAAPRGGAQKYVIFVKSGTYNEYISVDANLTNLVLVGEGMNNTVITGNRNYSCTHGLHNTSTFAVAGRNFTARDISFENTAGPHADQAIAFYSHSDCSILYRCGFRGYQDTLLAHSLRQFYLECQISGTIDFIFGKGACVFQRCKILVRQPLAGQRNVVTAHGREASEQFVGFSFQNCIVEADESLKQAMNTTRTYLGRPWKPFSTTVFMNSYLGELVDPRGWLEMNGNEDLGTLYYGEYMNYGPGAGLADRVDWNGFHSMTRTDVSNFTVASLINGNAWLPHIDDVHVEY